MARYVVFDTLYQEVMIYW